MSFIKKIHLAFAALIAALLLFMVGLVFLEHIGVSRTWLGAICFIASTVLYMLIGLYCHTTQIDQYYVAGRSVPALYNGMAAAASWMSVATFVTLSGSLYAQGFLGSPEQPGGLAYLIGTTGGFFLLGLLLVPYLRRMQLYTLAEFFERRYGGNWARRIAMLATVLISFIYMVAQIYGVGLIASKLSGLRFEIGMLLGLSGILVCSFLGGMRAVTWTQVAQYMVLLLAFVIAVAMLSYKQTGSFLAPVQYAKQLQKVTKLEHALRTSKKEQEVTQLYAQYAVEYAARLHDVSAALYTQQQSQQYLLQQAYAANPKASTLLAFSHSLKQLPRTQSQARALWQLQYQQNLSRSQPLAGMPAAAHITQDLAPAKDAWKTTQRNIWALIFCVFVGVLGLPHVLTRYYTTASVADTRSSVAWTVFFVAILYICIPAMAVFVKYDIMHNLVGQRFNALPEWIGTWRRIAPDLIHIQDVNQDGILQFAELHIQADMIMLAMPEIAGLPFAVSAIVAAGGLAAALSTADSLLLTIGTTLAHDGYYRELNPHATNIRRVMVSKLVLLFMALAAAYIAAHHLDTILHLVMMSLSLAGSIFVPALVLGIFWKKATRRGAIAGMLTGCGVAVIYWALHTTALQNHWYIAHDIVVWTDIRPEFGAVFGVPCGALAIVLVSLLDKQHQPLA